MASPLSKLILIDSKKGIPTYTLHTFDPAEQEEKRIFFTSRDEAEDKFVSLAECHHLDLGLVDNDGTLIGKYECGASTVMLNDPIIGWDEIRL